MRRLLGSRAGLAASVAALCAAAIGLILATAPATGGLAALTPDLVTLPIDQEDVAVTSERGRTLLRLSNEVGNQGNGPLEVFPSPASANCDGDGDPANDRDASQRVFADENASGTYERGVDVNATETKFGCMRYHAAHDHWHVLDFARYSLQRERGGKVVATSRKVGFCLVDNRMAFQGQGVPGLGRYPYGAATEGCDEQATQGLSPGWADIYQMALAGQSLYVEKLKRGRYCLTSEADPFDLLDELDEENNVRRARIMLRPKKLSVRKLPGACRLKPKRA